MQRGRARTHDARDRPSACRFALRAGLRACERSAAGAVVVGPSATATSVARLPVSRHSGRLRYVYSPTVAGAAPA
ncbi:hypothetical protein LC55x_4235 [Lysobacter capsici]|nr:hypothetical protein LC55x_4235 [Lysobacter capsici]